MTHISEVLGGDWMDEVTRKHEEALKQILEDIHKILGPGKDQKGDPDEPLD